MPCNVSRRECVGADLRYDRAVDARGTICAHCAIVEAEEPCPACRQAVCISCLLDRGPCRHEGRVAGERTQSAEALRTLASCGVMVAGDRLLGTDVPLWMIEGVQVAPLDDPKPGRPDVLAVSVLMRSGYTVEVLRRSESKDVDEVHDAARALAELAGTAVTYLDMPDRA